ncbi:Phenylalanine/tyrosine ammonia-lyase [Lasiodiplodia theobromae]|uniref:Phenylalanine/tyrosine ammonia-lyase n=1 Tax=Lasiodiplodia theobromae TaxID=45133 RepID=A0A5N5CZC4_9PEZI|nr:Phenylalanine/tyrosine ammonia-lyase [Lasiodiplodia theobromae]
MGDLSLPAPTVSTAHARSTYDSWARIKEHLNQSNVVVDGESLEIPGLVAVARHGSKPVIDKSPQLVSRIDESVKMLQRHLDRGDLVYGVNTGYGGSADTRTNDVVSLQSALIQHQQSGILSSNDTGRPFLGQQQSALHHVDDYGALSMPTSWVKGLMLQRVNSIVRGHSAVSLAVIDAIMALLEHDITPVIPLRGSISASGDLQPLSYVAGAIQGNPDIFVRVGTPSQIMPASVALQSRNLQPVVLGAKEGLGLLNGTSASSSAASIAIYEANHLALLTQTLTAMAVEALNGTAESFSPFIARVRPHRGQIEVASNIYGFLQGSRLSSGLDGEKDMHMAGLCQDRYPLRTSSQWIGPQLEDLLLATEQISVELNSTTDNPLIDVNTDLVHHGGNFQAASITSAMEKTRTAIQMFGKLLFAQGTELLNSGLSKGLPPNLSADDPSLSFTCKGIDINLAAYMSELAYLANPVSSHVQSAEIHNQAVNSLALISSRYTLQSIEVLSQMCAAYLYALCQALDLRVLQSKFLAEAYASFNATLIKTLNDAEPSQESFADPKAVQEEVWAALKAKWNSSTNEDLAPRAASAAQAAAMAFLYRVPNSSAKAHAFEESLKEMLQSTYAGLRTRMFEEHVDLTPPYLGQASRKVYRFVRVELGVPFHRGLMDCPEYGVRNGVAGGDGRQRKTVGSWISIIYEALRAGLLHKPIMEALVENGV